MSGSPRGPCPIRRTASSVPSRPTRRRRAASNAGRSTTRRITVARWRQICRQRPAADHRVAVEQPVNVGNDLVEIREVENPSSWCHRWPRWLEGIVLLIWLGCFTVGLHTLESGSQRTPRNPPFARGGELRRSGPFPVPPLRRGGSGGCIRIALGVRNAIDKRSRKPILTDMPVGVPAEEVVASAAHRHTEGNEEWRHR